ncbi:hypothetical protein RJ639_026755 [Escallonia herrerae]|uniref:Uncharacterized protein n=1 Tax=Escallonia herrerae TaxID=1293975 RepID=A0AA89BFG8_9ASTE|nr:hypothetical protein RJ639_026755 [Escallonia herrerae]
MGSSFVWFCLATLLLPWLAASAAQRTYIVHMNHHEKPASYPTHHDWYTAHLQSLPSATTQDSLLYTYTTAFHGFAASLDDAQAESLLRSDSVLALYEERVYTLHTTRTPEFLGIGTELGLDPTAVLSFGGTVLDVRPSPVVAAFSSRGPNLVTPQILKPDVIGPGVNILAGWSDAIGPTGLDTDTRKAQFNIMSGPRIMFKESLLTFVQWSRVVRYTRELTNVGAAGSVYQVSVDAPPAVGVTVEPPRLIFRNVGDKLRYTVTFVSKNGANQMTRSTFGSISWKNAEHQVRSPVAFAWTRL